MLVQKDQFQLLMCCYNPIIIRSHDINIQSSAAYIWPNAGNQYEFRKYPKISIFNTLGVSKNCNQEKKDGGLAPPTSGLRLHCSTT